MNSPAPGPLPANLVGLPKSAVADIGAACDPLPPGMGGMSWWSVTLTTPAYDATSKAPDGTYNYATDPAVRAVTGTANLRAATAAEAAAALAAARIAARAAIDAHRDAILSGGYRYDFGGAAGAKALQTRPEDATNWLTMQSSCLAAVAGGQGAAQGPTIRTADNTIVPLTRADGLKAMLALAAWGSAVYGTSWALKDKISGAVDGSGVAGVDITVGWPASA